MTREITLSEVSRGIDEGIVRLVTDPNMDSGTVAEIGGSWFYFDGVDAEGRSPDEYARDFPQGHVARRIHEALREFENEAEYSDEWAYYRAVFDEIDTQLVDG